MGDILSRICKRAGIKDVNEIRQEELDRQEKIRLKKIEIYTELDKLSQSNRRIRKYLESGKTLSPKDQDRYDKQKERHAELCKQVDGLCL